MIEDISYKKYVWTLISLWKGLIITLEMERDVWDKELTDTISVASKYLLHSIFSAFKSTISALFRRSFSSKASLSHKGDNWLRRIV